MATWDDPTVLWDDLETTWDSTVDVEDLVTVEDVITIDSDVFITLLAETDPAGTMPVLRESWQMPPLTEANPVYQPRVDYPVVSEIVGTVHLWIAGRDVTYFRGVPTKILRWDSEAPFGDKTAAWEFPQMEPWEKPGVGAWSWLRRDAEVVIGYVSPEGVVTREWEGFWDSRDRDRSEGVEGGTNLFEAQGEMWAALHHNHEPLPYMPPTDIGIVIPRLLNALPGRRFPKIPTVITGIKTRTRGNRDQKTWQVVQDIFAEAWTDDGRQWTLRKAGGKPRLALKKAMGDVAATVAWGTPLVELDLTVDQSSAVDVVWARGKTKGGGEWANVHYPGLVLVTPPPFPNDPVRFINLGAADEDTDTGTGVSDWQRKVVALGRWKTPAVNGVITSSWRKVMRAVQDDLGITVDGSLGPQTWEATFGAGIGSIDLTPVRVPMTVKPYAWPVRYDSHGAATKNPLWKGDIIPREVALDLGTNITRSQGMKACRTYLAIHGEPSATGSVAFIGDPNGVSKTALDIGDNLRVTGLEGESTVVQLASKTCELDGDDDGRQLVVSFTFDERARDALTIDQILERNRASQPDPARRPGNPNRLSRSVRDEGYSWDIESPCGHADRIAVNGSTGLWTRRLMPVGEFGTIAAITISADRPFSFFLAANLGKTPNQARALIGNPFATPNPYRPHLAVLDRDWGFIESWGAQDDACGYSPLTEGEDGATFTGDFIFKNPLDFVTDKDPYLAIFMFFRGGSGFADLRAYPAQQAG